MRPQKRQTVLAQSTIHNVSGDCSNRKRCGSHLERNALEHTVCGSKRIAELNVLEVKLPTSPARDNLLVLSGLLDGGLQVSNPEEVVGCRVGLGEAWQVLSV